VVRAKGQAFLSGILLVTSIAMLAWPWTRGATGQDPRQWWGPLYTNTRVASGLVECTRFLREHTAETDVVQEAVTLDLTPMQIATSRPILGGLSERRCYLGRHPTFWELYDPNPSLHKESFRRAELVRRIGTAKSGSELNELAAQTGIRWYVRHAEQKLDWPEAILARPVFQADDYKVYDLTSADR
jgi:hypothetical protein